MEKKTMGLIGATVTAVSLALGLGAHLNRDTYSLKLVDDNISKQIKAFNLVNENDNEDCAFYTASGTLYRGPEVVYGHGESLPTSGCTELNEPHLVAHFLPWDLEADDYKLRVEFEGRKNQRLPQPLEITIASATVNDYMQDKRNWEKRYYAAMRDSTLKTAVSSGRW